MSWFRSGRKSNRGHQSGFACCSASASGNVRTGAEQLAFDLRTVEMERHLEDVTKCSFTFAQLKEATSNFSQLLGRGGFGQVYKGRLKDQIVAVKKLNLESNQGIQEFVVEVVTLSSAYDPHLVKLLGFCAEGDERLLVYEYMSLGTLEDHLHKLPIGKRVLDWSTRMKIAAGAAKGLAYLHSISVIHRDIKSSNILIDDGYRAKLSDFGLAKETGDKSYVWTKMKGTIGYLAPEYASTGRLNYGSDIFSFGVVLLELITGRMAVDNDRKSEDISLVLWARARQPLSGTRRLAEIVDPLLQGKYPPAEMSFVIDIAEKCLQEDPKKRPTATCLVQELRRITFTSCDLLEDHMKHVLSVLGAKGRVKE